MSAQVYGEANNFIPDSNKMVSSHIRVILNSVLEDWSQADQIHMLVPDDTCLHLAPIPSAVLAGHTESEFVTNTILRRLTASVNSTHDANESDDDTDFGYASDQFNPAEYLIA